MRVVYARATTSIGLPTGGMVSIMEGTHWSADDPIVVAHPELFSTDPRYGMLFSQPLRPQDYPEADTDDDDPPPVERATATPGDRRNVRRG